mmetsp:Transcript_4651/g.8916  ORF Transcript_4651/g.8916 Transcript_4651/m.8916 type:complete len:325 (+) Transcript_4651:75-1049(+)
MKNAKGLLFLYASRSLSFNSSGRTVTTSIWKPQSIADDCNHPIGGVVKRRRHPIISSMKTQYTINDEVCPPMDPGELKEIVQKHCSTLYMFLEKKPIAKHTKAAFDEISTFVDPSKKIILDSGCGTARSTLLLGDMYTDHTVIGIDRSFVRLSRSTIAKQDDGDMDLLLDSTIPTENSLRPFQAVSSNVLLVRAELVDFWRCCWNAGWNISQHYILYPNPYPKKNRVKKRFYAHPSFPLLLKLGGDITLRSNWEGYLKEFADSVKYAHEFYSSESSDNFALPYIHDANIGPLERMDKSVSFTNFEKKYDNVGENTFQLQLRRSK